MNKTLIWVGILTLAVILGIGAAALAAPALQAFQSTSPGYPLQSQNAAPVATAIPVIPGNAPATVPPAVPNGNGWRGNYHGGMMGMNGHGMMDDYGYGMMDEYGYNPSAPSTEPITADQAKAAAEAYIQSTGLPGLQVAEVMIFSNNAYVVVKESDTGRGAFELLVDSYTPQFAYPEYGPNMMWNLKYSGMAHGRRGGMGMMGNQYYANPGQAANSAEMSVTPEQAVRLAQSYLDQYVPGTVAATDPIPFYGYYTLDFENNGQVIGMLSINGFSGQVFPHTWHDIFISEKEYDK